MKWSAFRPYFTQKLLGLIFPIIMLCNPDYIIEGIRQAAAQGYSWQVGVNDLALLFFSLFTFLLLKAIQSMHAVSLTAIFVLFSTD